MSENDLSIWSQTKRALLIVTFDDLERLLGFRKALRDTGLNVNDSHVICFVKNKNERKVLQEISSVSFVHTSDFTFLGKLKDDATQKAISRIYDLLIVVGDLDKRYARLIKKVKRQVDVGVNSNVEFLTINLNSENNAPEHLINFVKQTLMKLNR